MACQVCEDMHAAQAALDGQVNDPFWTGGDSPELSGDDPRVQAAAASCIVPDAYLEAVRIDLAKGRTALRLQIDEAKSLNRAHVVIHGIGVAALAYIPVIGPILAGVGAVVGQVPIEEAERHIRDMERSEETGLIKARAHYCCDLRRGSDGRTECERQTEAVDDLPALRIRARQLRDFIERLQRDRLELPGYFVTPDGMARRGTFRRSVP